MMSYDNDKATDKEIMERLKKEIADLKGEIKSMAIGLGIAERAIANAELFDKDWHEFSLTNT